VKFLLKKEQSTPKPPVRSTRLSPDTKLALYKAVASEEHCSKEIFAGNKMDIFSAQEGSLFAIILRPSVCLARKICSSVILFCKKELFFPETWGK
jgi:hypothetical protein